MTKSDWPTNSKGPLAGYFTVGPIAQDVQLMILGFAPTPDETKLAMKESDDGDAIDWVSVPRVGADGKLIVADVPTPGPTPTIQIFTISQP